MADKTITKTELVASIASATGQSQSAVSGVLDSLFSTVSEACLLYTSPSPRDS